MIIALVTLLVAVSVLAASCLYLALLIRKHQDEAEMQYNNSQFWHIKWTEEAEANLKLQSEYNALDQGNTEIEENYQQEMLSLYDQTEHWAQTAMALEEIRLKHDVFCLPQFGDDFYPMSDEEETPVYDSIVKG